MRSCLLVSILLLAACATDDTTRPPPVPQCATTADCETGTCLNTRCVADGSVAGGQACDLDQQCRSETCLPESTCEPAVGEAGGACDTGNTCDPDVSCLVDICVADGSVAGGATCSQPAQCASGECLTNPFICAAGVGESCSAAQCATGSSCLVNTCVGDGSIADNDTCSEDEQCQSGDCDNFVCQAGACNPTEPVGGTSFTGSADAALASDAVLVVMWVVSSGSPDYEWIFGDVSASGTSMPVNLATEPPPEAVNSYGLAIGVVVAFPAGTVISPGLYVDPGVEWLGATDRHAIIWKASCATDLEWSGTFSAGYSCGVCIPARVGVFDFYAPTDCSNVMLNMDGDEFEFCNWT